MTKLFETTKRITAKFHTVDFIFGYPEYSFKQKPYFLVFIFGRTNGNRLYLLRAERCRVTEKSSEDNFLSSPADVYCEVLNTPYTEDAKKRVSFIGMSKADQKFIARQLPSILTPNTYEHKGRTIMLNALQLFKDGKVSTCVDRNGYFFWMYEALPLASNILFDEKYLVLLYGAYLCYHNHELPNTTQEADCEPEAVDKKVEVDNDM